MLMNGMEAYPASDELNVNGLQNLSSLCPPFLFSILIVKDTFVDLFMHRASECQMNTEKSCFLRLSET